MVSRSKESNRVALSLVLRIIKLSKVEGTVEEGRLSSSALKTK